MYSSNSSFGWNRTNNILEHRLIICKRAHSILTKLVGYSKEEIIFDLNTSSRPEHVRNIKLISCLFPNANFISTNLSSSKELYLYNIEHEKFAGLNMGCGARTRNPINYKNLNTEVFTCKSLNTKIFSWNKFYLYSIVVQFYK